MQMTMILDAPSRVVSYSESGAQLAVGLGSADPVMKSSKDGTVILYKREDMSILSEVCKLYKAAL